MNALDLDTVTDLQRLGEILSRRDDPAADVEAVGHGNWVRFFSEVLPDEVAP